MDTENTAKEVLENLLEKVGFTAEVSVTTDEAGVTYLNMSSSDQGMIIGYHGENLEALQMIVRTIVYRLLGEWNTIVVDIADYRAERTKKLQTFAARQAEKARFLSAAVSLPPMSASSRRELHLAVADIEGVESESAGEGNQRHVVIRPEGVEEQGSAEE